MLLKPNILICILLLNQTVTYSQKNNSEYSNDSKDNLFISVNYGFQMSGIKDEDFVSSNYSPLFNISAGKWLTPYFALQIGYKGFYFNYIEDDLKHHYNFFYGEAVLNFNNLVLPKRIEKFWNLLLHAGVGYFYNHVYKKPNLCANVGLQNNFQIASKFQLTLDVTSVIGWDIYQGNEDILPGITLGITYFFNGKK